MTPEKRIQNEILGFLKFAGVFAWQNDSVGIYDPKIQRFRKNKSRFHLKGVSDILGVIGGRFLAIEVKTEAGRLTPEQRAFLVNINTEGGIAFVARSLEQCIQQLSAHFPENKRFKAFANDYLQSKGADH